MSEALDLDFPNSHQYDKTTSPWDNLKFVEFEMPSEEESISHLEKIVETEKQNFQTIAKEQCGDKEGTLTSDSLKVYQDEYVPRSKEVEDAYCSLTETQLNLLETKDEKDASSKHAAAEEFANSLDPSGLGIVIARDVTMVGSALGQLRRTEINRQNIKSTDNWIKCWMNDRRDTREAVDRLKSCGYNPDGPQTEVFQLVLQQAKAMRYGIPTRNAHVGMVLGRKRASDYQETKLLLDDPQTGDACRRALKEAGYKKLPESWNDEQFCASDMAEICHIARSCEK